MDTPNGKAMQGHREKADTGQRLASEDTNFTQILILDFQPPGLCGNKFLLLKPSCLWYSPLLQWPQKTS